MWKFQTVLTLIVAGVFVIAAGCVRPLPPIDSPDAYWARKMLWGPQFDIVLAGDSRTNRGLAPSLMSNHLPGLRIANFAFQSTGFNREYLSEAERRLDPNGKRVIILGVTTVSLTPRAIADNKFLEMKRKHIAELQQQVSFESFLEFFRPVDWEEVNRPLHDRTGTKVKIYHADGWTAVIDDPPKPSSAIPFFREYYVNNRVAPEIVDELLEIVEEWTGKGITVIGFRPPTTIEMLELEERIAGFDEAGFVKRFKAAGGIWLDSEHGKYLTHDGSHLQARDARRFSAVIAKRVKSILEPGR